jgi:ATP-dependent Clp protease protease subunit
MRKPSYSVINNQSNKVPQILLYGIIGSDYWEIGIEAKYFKQDLTNLAETHPRIDLRINCPGGSTWDGIAMVNAITSCPAEIHTFNDGIAFSMAALILLAGNKVHVAKGSLTMIHSAGGGCDGNADDMREYAALLDKHDEVLCTMLADRTGKTEAEVKTLWMDYKDHYLTGKEMVDQGLADFLEEYDTQDTPADPQNMSREAVMAYYKDKTAEPSPALIAKITAQVKEHITNQNSNMKNFVKIMALAAVNGGTVTAEILAEANAALTENGITNYGIYPESIVTDAATQTAENLRLTSEVTALSTRATTAETALDIANTTIANLNAKIVAFGKVPGATHVAEGGVDINAENPEDKDIDAAIANMPHNKAADGLTY